MIEYYYYALLMRAIVFMLLGKMISDSNIWQGRVSTMGLRICLILLHKLRVIKLFLNCVTHGINIKILLSLSIYVELYASNQL